MLFTPARRNYGFDLFDEFFSDPFFTTPTQHTENYLMRTDITEDDVNYNMDIELPGYKKEDIRAELKEGYLTIAASHEQNNEEKDKTGKIIRQERFSGSCKRSFFVGKNLKQEDIRASFENGILKLSFPKEAPKAVAEEPKYIQIAG
jgi:HSP20 family molecular chaperone IbpA